MMGSMVCNGLAVEVDVSSAAIPLIHPSSLRWYLQFAMAKTMINNN